MVEIFTRLTHNINDWETPSGHTWKVSNQGKSNVPYENQHGFGHEEWLFNVRYNLAGWQYGYIRGLRSASGIINKVHLYTVKKEKEQNIVYYLGSLNNVEVLNDKWRSSFPKVSKAFDQFSNKAFDEVEAINGNASILYNDSFVPILRFKDDEAELLDEPLLLSNFPLSRYKRFQPYKITDEILKCFNQDFIRSQASKSFLFSPGKANQTQRFNRYMAAGSKAVIKKHCQIVDELEKFLKPTYSLSKKNVSIENSRFKGNIADVVTLEKDESISIYEVKTSLSIRKNIREALGQLLDYASHALDVKITNLVIVSPSNMDKESELFIRSLRKAIRYPINYLKYAEIGEERFIKYGK